MNTAFAAWNDRIAPLFDVAQQVWVVEMEDGRMVAQRREAIEGAAPSEKALCLARLGVNVLVCGAISAPLQALVASHGIQIVPFVAGGLREVIAAWMRGELLRRPAFAMPGCCGRWRMESHGGKSGKEDVQMPGQGQGRGAGKGSGGGRGMRRAGKQGGPLAAGPEGLCVCPRCGYAEPHARGTPCTGKKCPTCGISLTRK